MKYLQRRGREVKAPLRTSKHSIGAADGSRNQQKRVAWKGHRKWEESEPRRKMLITVESYSGYRAEERPLRFVLSGRCYEVTQVEDRWYSRDAIYFRVLASDGNRYVLGHDQVKDVWSLEAYRAS